MLPGADEGGGDQRVGDGGDGAPAVGHGVVAVQRLAALRPKVPPHHVQLVARGHGVAAHPLGRHVAHARPLVAVAVEAVRGRRRELSVAAHDEDLAAQDGGGGVPPWLRTLSSKVPAVTHGVVALHLQGSEVRGVRGQREGLWGSDQVSGPRGLGVRYLESEVRGVRGSEVRC